MHKEEKVQSTRTKYLGIMFNCCNVYARIYKNKDATAYIGYCPKCRKKIRIAIGKDGIGERIFNAY